MNRTVTKSDFNSVISEFCEDIPTTVEKLLKVRLFFCSVIIRYFLHFMPGGMCASMSHNSFIGGGGGGEGGLIFSHK